MFQLQGLPHTSLEGSGQAQLPQLWLHGVGELLQGPWVQGHSESGFVSGSSEVHFRVFRKPPQEKTSSRRGGSWLAHQPCMKLASPGLAAPPCPCLLLAGSQLGAQCCRERGLRSSVPGTSFHPIPPYRTKYPDYSFLLVLKCTYSFTSSFVRLVKRRPTSPLNFLLTYRTEVGSAQSH